jgi:hypothetical protein
MSDRKSFLRKLLLTAALLAAYYLFVRCTGISLPCLFHSITGLQCPGCGVTHMLLYMAQFDFSNAFASNPMLFCLFSLFCVLIVVKLALNPDWLKNGHPVFNTMVWCCCILLMLFGIIRNVV